MGCLWAKKDGPGKTKTAQAGRFVNNFVIIWIFVIHLWAVCPVGGLFLFLKTAHICVTNNMPVLPENKGFFGVF